MTAATEIGTGSGLSSDTRVALRNAAKLTMSLVATWAVGLVVRFWLPRHLGPERFGLLSFADGFASTAIGCASLGIDTYIQKEIPIRPQAASGFYGGTVILRTLLSFMLLVGLLLVPIEGRQAEVRLLLLVYGAGYLVVALNASLTALLQANATVDELARVNVGAKIVWGLGMGAGILLHLPLVGFATVFAASEGLKALALQLAARTRLGLRFLVDVAATRTAVVASLGFYANSVAQVLGWRLDVTLLGFLAHDADVGWYGASQTLASITLLLAPILSAVLTPLVARAYYRSPEEMIGVLRRTLEGIIALTAPVALMLALGAEEWIRIAFGPAFAPAAGSLRMLAPLFVLIYVSILLGTALIVQARGWRLTAIALSGIGVHTAVALCVVPAFSRWLGPGGAGTAMALAAVSREVFVAFCLLYSLGFGVIDARRWGMIGRTTAAALGTTALHVVLAPLGTWRILVDLAVYPVLAVVLGALRPEAVVGLVRQFVPARR